MPLAYSQGHLNVDISPSVVNRFAAEYAPTAELWDNVASNLQLLIDTFREHASKNVEGGTVAPLMTRTDELFLEKIQKLLDAVITFRDYISQDVNIMRNAAESLQLLAAETSALMDRTDIPQ